MVPEIGESKLVLIYTKFYETKNWTINFSECPFKCELTVNKTSLNRSDAVIVQAHYKMPPPLLRDPALHNQIWIFVELESPVNSGRHYGTRYDNFYNWTISYRRDSDFPLLHGWFIPVLSNESQSIAIPTVDSIREKKLVAAMITNCNVSSRRESYISEFQKFAPLDFYGSCGNLSCSTKINCYEVLGKKYKFWLSFENSICKDYITEKFFEPLRYGMVPVVYGYGPSYDEVAPKGSYINALDFPSPKHLANYLHHLHTHPQEYLRYFSWRKRFRLPTVDEVLIGDSIGKNFCCRLCEKLHKTDLKTERKWYSSPGNWHRTNNTNISLCIPQNNEKSRNKKPKKEKIIRRILNAFYSLF